MSFNYLKWRCRWSQNLHWLPPWQHTTTMCRGNISGQNSGSSWVQWRRDGVITAELRAEKQTHSFTVAALGPSPAQPSPAQPSRLGIVTARLLGDHLGPEVSREPSLSGFNAPWALIITTYHIGHYCVVRTAKKVGPWLLTAASRYESSFDGVNRNLGTLFIWYKGDCGGGGASVYCPGKEPLFANPCFSISLVLIAQNQIRTPNGLGKAK